MFGVFGMIFAIPLTAVIYTLLRDMANAKEERNKPIPVEEAETVEEIKEDESETDE